MKGKRGTGRDAGTLAPATATYQRRGTAHVWNFGPSPHGSAECTAPECVRPPYDGGPLCKLHTDIEAYREGVRAEHT